MQKMVWVVGYLYEVLRSAWAVNVLFWERLYIFRHYLYWNCLTSSHPFCRCLILLLPLSLPFCHFYTSVGRLLPRLLDLFALFGLMSFFSACLAHIESYVSEEDLFFFYYMYSFKVKRCLFIAEAYVELEPSYW